MVLPYFSYLKYKDSNFSTDDGYISDIQIVGDQTPLTVTITGPYGYTAGPFILPPDTVIPDQVNLKSGAYTLTVIDANNYIVILVINILRLPETILTAIADNSCDCGTCQCTIEITNYIHNSDCFVYNIYKDGVLYDTYTGCTGDEVHTFTDLCTAAYTIDAIETDIILHTYNNPGGCGDGITVFNYADDPDIIFTYWSRWVFLAKPTMTIPGGLSRPTGLIPASGVITNASGTYFERGVSYDLGDYALAMTEGANIGPAVASATNYNEYYYNTILNKYIVCLEVGGGSPTMYWWCTFDPTVDVSLALGNPTATQYLTTAITQWLIKPLTPTQYTINAANIVVLASTKATFPKMIECVSNSAFYNGFYSVCSFGDYTHEVTFGCTDLSDGDSIGVVIAAFRDVDGSYGPIDRVHTLSLVNSIDDNMCFIGYNIGELSYAFYNNDPINPAYSHIVLGKPSIFGSVAGYIRGGYVRVRIKKVGSRITIEKTGRMGGTPVNLPLGALNPYETTLLFDFDLDDATTWLNRPAYATGNELKKFKTKSQIGYLTGSQRTTQFFDMAFTGIQIVTGQEIIDDAGAMDSVIFQPCPCYRIINCKDRLEQHIVNTIDLAVLDVTLIYTFAEYPDKCWLVNVSNNCTVQSIVTVVATFETCETCEILKIEPCFELIDCTHVAANIITNTDLTIYVGQVIKIKGCPDICWEVNLLEECPLNSVVVQVLNSFVDCDTCLPIIPPIPTPTINLRNRTVTPGYDTIGCSPEYVDKISCKFAEAMFQHAASRRYGIDFCCMDDANKWIIKKELLDLKMITDSTLCLSTIPPCSTCDECDNNL